MSSGENFFKKEAATLIAPDYVPDWCGQEYDPQNFGLLCRRLMELGINSAGSHVFLDSDDARSTSLFVRSYPAAGEQESNLRLILKQTNWHEAASTTYDYMLNLDNEAMTCARSQESTPLINSDGKRQLHLSQNSAPALMRSGDELTVYYGRAYADTYDERSLDSNSGVLAAQLLEQLVEFNSQNRLEINLVQFRAVS